MLALLSWVAAKCFSKHIKLLVLSPGAWSPEPSLWSPQLPLHVPCPRPACDIVMCKLTLLQTEWKQKVRPDERPQLGNIFGHCQRRLLLQLVYSNELLLLEGQYGLYRPWFKGSLLTLTFCDSDWDISIGLVLNYKYYNWITFYLFTKIYYLC